MDEEKVRAVLAQTRGFTHVIHERIRRQLPDGLNMQHMMLMKALVTDGPQPQGHFADLLGLSKGGVSQIVSRLEAEGMVERRRDPDDARVQWLHLTPEASSRADEMEARMASLFADLFQDWDDADADRLIGLMQAMMLRARS